VVKFGAKIGSERSVNLKFSTKNTGSDFFNVDSVDRKGTEEVVSRKEAQQIGRIHRYCGKI
jgi:hypothetical protein